MGADATENLAGDGPISFGTSAVRVTETVKGHDSENPATELDLGHCQRQPLILQLRNSTQRGK